MRKYFEILKAFAKNDGQYILIANIGGKVLSFLTSILIIQLLPKESFGKLTYSLSIIAFIIPFSGLGLQKAFLRFAPTLKTDEEVNNLFYYTFQKGILYALGLVAFVLTGSFLLKSMLLADSIHFIQIIAFLIIGLFLFELISSYFLVIKNNKQYALIQLLKPLFVLVLTIVIVPYSNAYVYALILVSSPLIIFTYGVVKSNKPKLFHKPQTAQFSFLNDYLKYGIHTGFGGMLSDLLYAIDILMLGYFLDNPTEIATYKVGILIPINLLVLPLSYINTSFTTIAQEYKNVVFLKKYVTDYFKLFFLVIIGICVVLIPFSEFWMSLFFGEEYLNGNNVFIIAVIGIVGGMLLRVPFGNINSAIGKAHWNTYNALFILLFNGVLNYYLIQEYGIVGAAITTAISLWLSGLISFSLFSFYVAKLTK